jgi:prolipoprotein diacylglyceryltransferase
VWRVHRAGADWRLFGDAAAPAILVAQAVGRIGNYFNQELFGGPTNLPWALEISLARRPPGYTQYRTFTPTFLYELIFDLALAALLVWLGHHRSIRPPGLLALYVTGYSAFRIYEDSVRIDTSQYFFGHRLNFFTASVFTAVGLAWFLWTQRRRPAAKATAVAGSGPDGPAADGEAVPGDGAEPEAGSLAHEPAAHQGQQDPGPRPRNAVARPQGDRATD